jgi:hypothetical protein
MLGSNPGLLRCTVLVWVTERIHTGLTIVFPKSLKFWKTFSLQDQGITAKVLVVGMGKRKEECTRDGSDRDKRQYLPSSKIRKTNRVHPGEKRSGWKILHLVKKQQDEGTFFT